MNLFKILCLASASILALPAAAQQCAPGNGAKKCATKCTTKCTTKCCANTIPALKGTSMQTDRRVISYILPKRIMWKESTAGSTIENEGILLKNNYGQTALGGISFCHIKNTAGGTNSMLFDFGAELQGGIQVVTGGAPANKVRLRVRFGESASEAMCEIDGKNGATNDHALRDFILEIPGMGVAECGNSGFRFVRIDVLGDNTDLQLQEVRAAFRYRDIPYLGSFECDNERLNKIWMTGAYTVHLNMQQFLWDGIKRDRLVWTGDINPEVLTIATVFGANDVVNKSLDLSKENFKPTEWMCTISSYSIWWMITHYQWYMYTGNRKYLDEQKEYTTQLLGELMKYVDGKGYEKLNARFLDWPSSENPKGIDAGLQALMAIAFDTGAKLETIWGNDALAKQCSDLAAKMKKCRRDFNNSKQAASLNAIAGMIAPEKAAKKTILVGGAKDFSTFYGYYMLEALALSGNYTEAMDIMSEYWGAMIDLGATTFWEDFNLDWTKNAARIDELVPEGKVDIHKSYGNYCYKGFRHSFCHGWASGPTTWLSAHVLGVKVLEAGCRKVAIEPHLGKLKWAKGTFPTPYGVIKISHRVGDDGKVVSDVQAPDGVEIVASDKK
jgi:alpha-L-rhamnosidase